MTGKESYQQMVATVAGAIISYEKETGIRVANIKIRDTGMKTVGRCLDFEFQQTETNVQGD